MTNPYRLEQAEAEISRQEAIRQQEMERQLAQSQPAETGDAATLPAQSESEAMRAQLQDRPVSPQVLAEQRLDASTPAGMDTPEAGQMTDTPLHLQGDNPDCLLQCARMAEHRQLGADPGLEAYKDRAIEKGPEAYSSRGTDKHAMRDIINERPGLSAELKTQQQPEQIKAELDNGDSVIALVDGTAYYTGRAEPNFEGHAIVVTSAEQTPAGDWKLTVNDPNRDIPNEEIPWARFQKAWGRQDNQMLVVRKIGVV